MEKLQIKLSKLLLNCGFIKLKSKNKYVYSVVDDYAEQKIIKLNIEFKKHTCIITCEDDKPQVCSRLDDVMSALHLSRMFGNNHVFNWHFVGFWKSYLEIINDLNGVK